MKTKIFLPFIFMLIAALFIIPACKKENKKDITQPVIKLNPPIIFNVDKDSTYKDPGATAIDDKDGDISSKIVKTSNVNTADTGYYHVKYNVSDKAGNAAVEKIRTVHVMIF